jgi:hypothetical protein
MGYRNGVCYMNGLSRRCLLHEWVIETVFATRMGYRNGLQYMEYDLQYMEHGLQYMRMSWYVCRMLRKRIREQPSIAPLRFIILTRID